MLPSRTTRALITLAPELIMSSHQRMCHNKLWILIPKASELLHLNTNLAWIVPFRGLSKCWQTLPLQNATYLDLREQFWFLKMEPLLYLCWAWLYWVEGGYYFDKTLGLLQSAKFIASAWKAQNLSKIVDWTIKQQWQVAWKESWLFLQQLCSLKQDSVRL